MQDILEKRGTFLFLVFESMVFGMEEHTKPIKWADL